MIFGRRTNIRGKEGGREQAGSLERQRYQREKYTEFETCEE